MSAPASAPRRRAGLAPAALAGIGGLLAAGGTVAEWVRRDEVRDVGGVLLPEVTGVPGTRFAGGLVGVGVAAVVLGAALLVARGRARAALGAVLGLAGLAGLGLLTAGLAAAAARPGGLTAGPGVTGLGLAAVLGGAVAAVRRPAARPSLPARYALDDSRPGDPRRDDPDPEDGGAAEWDRASVEADGP